VACDCAKEVVAGLRPGDTECDAAARLGAALRARGAQAFFHQPFGDRAGFRGFVAPSVRRHDAGARWLDDDLPHVRAGTSGASA
jgi:hypothetical protein